MAKVEVMREVLEDPDVLDTDPELAAIADQLPTPWVLAVWIEENERLLAAGYGPAVSGPG